MKKFLPAAVISFLLLTACNKQSHNNTITATCSDKQLRSAQQINSFSESEVQQKETFVWKDASTSMVRSALQLRDNMMCIGYKPAAAEDIAGKLSVINLNKPSWKEAKQQVLDIIFKEELKRNPSLKREALEVWKENKLPVIDVKITSLRTIELLRQCPLVRYAEPMAYDPIAEEEKAVADKAYSLADAGAGGSGCGDYSGNTDLVAAEYTRFQLLPAAMCQQQ